jgi:hypothetical protein
MGVCILLCVCEIKARVFSVYATLILIIPRKIRVREDGRITETCSAVK